MGCDGGVHDDAAKGLLIEAQGIAGDQDAAAGDVDAEIAQQRLRQAEGQSAVVCGVDERAASGLVHARVVETDRVRSARRNEL